MQKISLGKINRQLGQLSLFTLTDYTKDESFAKYANNKYERTDKVYSNSHIFHFFKALKTVTRTIF